MFQTDEQTDGWTDRRVERQTGGQTDIEKVIRRDGRTLHQFGRAAGWMDEQTECCTEIQTDGQSYRWMDRWRDGCILSDLRKSFGTLSLYNY